MSRTHRTLSIAALAICASCIEYPPVTPETPIPAVLTFNIVD